MAYSYFNELIPACCQSKRNEVFILKKDLLHEKLKLFLISVFRIKKQIKLVQETYKDMVEQFPQYLNKPLDFNFSDF